MSESRDQSNPESDGQIKSGRLVGKSLPAAIAIVDPDFLFLRAMPLERALGLLTPTSAVSAQWGIPAGGCSLAERSEAAGRFDDDTTSSSL